MVDQSRYRLNSPQVVSEAVDDETIVVNLDTGTYYSIKGDGMLLWNAFIDGASLAEIAGAVAEQTGASSELVEKSVAAFSTKLRAEGLIVPSDSGAGPSSPLDLSDGGSGLLEPSLESYSDMQDLILLDPVHEVDEQGWPHVQAGA
jgi:hypothetical protein